MTRYRNYCSYFKIRNRESIETAAQGAGAQRNRLSNGRVNILVMNFMEQQEELLVEKLTGEGIEHRIRL